MSNKEKHSDELVFDFSESQYPSIISRNSMQIVRFVSGITCVIFLLLSLWKFPFASQLFFMSHWGNHVAIISNFMAFYLGMKKSPTP